jgi:hypothetical protein
MPKLPVRVPDVTKRRLVTPELTGDDGYVIDAVYETEVIAQGETDEVFISRLEAYETEKTAWESRREAERQKVDRIAFSGRCPINVASFKIGDYILPTQGEDGKISAVAVTQPTPEQYMLAVGKVISMDSDGRAQIIVKSM